MHPYKTIYKYAAPTTSEQVGEKNELKKQQISAESRV